MTAMFIVILLEQCMEKKNRIPALIGLSLSLASLLIFGAQSFLIPAMIAITAALLLVIIIAGGHDRKKVKHRA